MLIHQELNFSISGGGGKSFCHPEIQLLYQDSKETEHYVSRFLYTTVTKWESALNEKRFVLLAVAEFTVYAWLVIASRGRVRVCGRVSSPYDHQEEKKRDRERTRAPTSPSSPTELLRHFNSYLVPGI